MVDPTAERPLSPMERAIWMLDQASPMHGIVVAEVDGPLDLETLRAASAAVATRHPLLGVHIEGPAPRFVAAGTEVPVVEAEGDPHALAEAELVRPFPPGGPVLARLTWVPRHRTLIAAFHHVIGDALSGMYWVRDVLRAAGGLVDEVQHPPRPALEALLPPEGRGWARAGALTRFVLGHMGRGPTAGFRVPGAPLSERRTRFVTTTLDAAETRALAQAARAAGTTVQGALVAAYLGAARTELGAPPRRTLGCFTAVSVRDQLGVGEELGTYVSQVTTYHRAGSTADVAREVKTQLDRVLPSGEAWVTLPLLSWFSAGTENPRAFAGRIDQRTPSAMGVTNLGRIPIQADCGALRLRNLHCAVGIAVAVPLAACVGTFEGRLTSNLLHVDPLVPPAQAARIQEAAFAALRAFGA